MYKVQVNGSTIEVTEKNGSTYLDGESFQPDILQIRDGRFHILLNNISYTAEIIESDPVAKTFSIKINRNIYTLQVSDQYDELLKQMGIDASAGKKINDIKAHM